MKANKNISEKVITKRFFNMVAKFIEDLKAFAEESETAAEYQEAAAPESGEAAADLLKMAAAVAFGFVGFYLTFAIFGI